MEYPKIQGLFKRYRECENKGRFIEGEYSLPEFEYLKDNKWRFEEKLDGTNIRICLYTDPLIQSIEFKGRHSGSQRPPLLSTKLEELFPKDKVFSVFEIGESKPDIILFGEGIGPKINNGGKYFIGGMGYDFILFDILVGEVWLKRENIEEIANKLNIRITPIVGYGTLEDGINLIKSKTLMSQFGKKDFLMEGIVAKIDIGLRDFRGNRIITKIKHADWR